MSTNLRLYFAHIAHQIDVRVIYGDLIQQLKTPTNEGGEGQQLYAPILNHNENIERREGHSSASLFIYINVLVSGGRGCGEGIRYMKQD